MLLSLCFLSLCFFVSAACAANSRRIPTLKKIPARAIKMAHDIEHDVFVVYDAQNEIIGQLPALQHVPSLDKRILGTCARLSSEDIQKLPGWEKLRQYAVDNWGEGWDGVVSNPEGYPDRAATVCVGNEVTKVTLDTPSCAALSSDTFTGRTRGTEVTVELTADQGTITSTTITVTSQATIGTDISVGASIEIPEVADISAKATFGVSFSNKQNTADTVTEESMQSQVVTMYAELDTECTLVVDKRRCDVNGSGSQRLVAHGWAWVNYGHEVQGHFKWAMNMDNILNEDERSSFINFRTSTSAEMSAEYRASCQKPLAEVPAQFIAHE